MRNFSLGIVVLLLLSACGDEQYAPKPEGYFRIALPERSYKLLEHDCSYQFEINEHARWLPQENCWGNLRYPSLKATLQLTYKPVENDSALKRLLDDAHRMAYEHTVKADGIEEKLFINEERAVYGLLYQFKGNAATNLQFYLTDSTDHFLRGALYFYASPNADSLRPVNQYMTGELVRLIETLSWQN